MPRETTVTNVQVRKEKLLSDLHEVVSDSEELLKAVQSVGGEKVHALREGLEHKVKSARERLHHLEADFAEHARAGAKAADQYVHVHPWQSIALATAVGGVLGVAMGLSLSRR